MTYLLTFVHEGIKLQGFHVTMNYYGAFYKLVFREGILFDSVWSLL